MSAQTDCEMLSIEVMEAYAGKYNLSGNKVVELFQKNQVFEKMLIQHEYLHQVSFEEVMEFVENVIADASRELVVYHGTCSEFEKINLNKSHNRRDFGKGVLYNDTAITVKGMGIQAFITRKTERLLCI